MTTTFDPIAFKQTTRAQWEEAAEAWHRWGPTIEDWLGDATGAMLQAAGIGKDDRVLDVAAGAGGQTLAAARLAGPGGKVLATDISPAILRYAARAATEAGIETVETLEADGENLSALPEGGYDAAISRVGLIYFPDQQAALQGIRRALRPGGKFSAVVYSTPDRNGFFADPGRHHPPPGRTSAAGTGSARPVQPRRTRGRREGLRRGWLPRHHGDDRSVAGPPEQRRGVCPVRTGLVRRTAPDAVPAGRRRQGGGVAGDHRAIGPVRGSGWVRRTVRDAGCHRHPLNESQAPRWAGSLTVLRL